MENNGARVSKGNLMRVLNRILTTLQEIVSELKKLNANKDSGYIEKTEKAEKPDTKYNNNNRSFRKGPQ